MDIVFGIAGVISLALFAAILGFDPRQVFGTRDHLFDFGTDDPDPNSTLGVTRDVLAEKLDGRQVDPLSAF